MVSERVVLNVRDEDRVELDASDNIFVDADYNKLKHLPKLDGRPIIGDIPELDPTVPDWAKAPTKPEYNAEEVGAIPEGAIRILDDGDFWEMIENM
nr:MAG TPA: hypothetical protein [Caudoviricetes sp.]